MANGANSPMGFHLERDAIIHAQADDLVQLVGPRDKSFILRLKPGGELHTHAGILRHDDMIGQQWGARVYTHMKKAFILLQPALDDLIRNIRRTTQILYPKDIGYLLVTMGIGPGKHVVEAGTGSGALTIAFAHAVGKEGRVTTYEKRPDVIALAKANLEHVGLSERVTFKLGDIGAGFDESDAHALFLDLPNPEDYITHVRAALVPGGFFGAILPTTNQVARLVDALKRDNFAFVEISELMHRYYKPSASRLRPADTMTAHTGFLIFARPVTTTPTNNGETPTGNDVASHQKA